MALAPEDAYPVSLMGLLRMQQGEYEEALDSLSRAAQMDPKDADTQNYLGITLSQLGQREASETAFRKAITLNPNNAGAHVNLAVIYISQKPPFVELAKFHYGKALALGHAPNPELEKQLNSAAQ
jgi:Flp pilus assembly protein TadD